MYRGPVASLACSLAVYVVAPAACPAQRGAVRRAAAPRTPTAAAAASRAYRQTVTGQLHFVLPARKVSNFSFFFFFLSANDLHISDLKTPVVPFLGTTTEPRGYAISQADNNMKAPNTKGKEFLLIKLH